MKIGNVKQFNNYIMVHLMCKTFLTITLQIFYGIRRKIIDFKQILREM